MAAVGDNCLATRKLSIIKTKIREEAMAAIKHFSGTSNSITSRRNYYRRSMNTSTFQHMFYSMLVEDLIMRLLDLAAKCGFKCRVKILATLLVSFARAYVFPARKHWCLQKK